MTKIVPDFGQAHITCDGDIPALQGPNHPPTCLVKDENNRTSKANDKNQSKLHTIYRKHPKEKATKQRRCN